ncbi:DoxX family membrane protein [candidate division KSB1 bacterium]|nr:DoxX family membrane protein [candidate division KSB1 bacterium]
MSNRISEKLSVIVALLRVAIGWHFLYEGIAKLFTPGWSSASYLDLSRWIFAPLFQWISNSQTILRIVDLLNIWGLLLIGLALMLGFFTRLACFTGASLLFLYYISNPPFIGMDFGVPTEGSYLVVNKNLIELFALLVLGILPVSKAFSIDQLLKQLRSSNPKGSPPDSNRREMIKNLATLPFLGALAFAVAKKKAWESHEEKNLVDVVTSASVKSFDFSSLGDLKGQIPVTKIKNMEVSRIILGGNLIGGWAHARDLIYASKLVKAYHHRDKIFETLLLAEKCGINALLTNPMLHGVVEEYWRRNIGKIQFISDCGGDDLLERTRLSIDSGAAACYVQGGIADQLVREGNFELIGQALNLIWDNGLPAGIGAHYIETVKECVDYGFEPDFWMKTFHHLNYWSANQEQEHDNIYCRKPEETTRVMQQLEKPWIAFKTLAAGAIEPKEGFRYAFENGADLLCVGMYDFQIVDDVNIALEVLDEELNRQRPWYA